MARTQRFTLGIPRACTISPDGARVVFVRSVSGSARTGLLWSIDVATGDETLVVDPAVLLGDGSGEELSAEERARRERMREGGAGITSYSTDKAATAAAFALSSRLFLADLVTGGARELPAAGAVVDPRLSPDGRHVAYAAHGALHLVSTHDGSSRALAEPDGEDVTWGLAEFVASEELERYRGHWWLPDSSALLVARVDEGPVGTWWVADPAHPATAPYAHRYPAAGTPNADVTLWLVRLDGSRTELRWDRAAFPYLLQVEIDDERSPLVQVSDRRQQHQQVLCARGSRAGGPARAARRGLARRDPRCPAVVGRAARHRRGVRRHLPALPGRHAPLARGAAGPRRRGAHRRRHPGLGVSRRGRAAPGARARRTAAPRTSVRPAPR